jgi:excisionase family DNA binding protein
VVILGHMLPNLLTPEQVREHLQVSMKTVYRLIRSGKLKAKKVGSQWRIKPEDLERFKEG